MPSSGNFILVVGHRALVDGPEGAAAMLRQLGSEVLTLDLWDEFAAAVDQARQGGGVRAMIFEASERPDLAVAALRAARKVPELSQIPTIVTLPPRQVTSFDPASGFDDFLIMPCVPAELYARIRSLEWRHSEFATEERLKIGTLVIDRAAHDVSVDGRHVILTAKEFALIAFLAGNRGRVFSREALLARVWGSRYEGGARTVDIHVRRLRAKLGDALPLDTLRGAGYKLRAPSDAGKSR
ncbi:MAG: winged helix-turn-helix domain-containing protein [Polyangiaceae bacterium]